MMTESSQDAQEGRQRFSSTPLGDQARHFLTEYQQNRRDALRALRGKISEHVDEHNAMLHELREQLHRETDPDVRREIIAAINSVSRYGQEVLRVEPVILPQARPGDQLALPEPEAEPEDEWKPVNESWRTYEGFRAYWVGREASVLKDTKPIRGKHATRKMLCNNPDLPKGGDSVKQLHRDMDHYHLTKETNGVKTYWPPSTWPEQEPPAKPDKPDRGLRAAHLVAAAMALPGVLDLFWDSKIDHIMRICHPLLGMIHKHF